jgi:5S rRNA maturation endonuclease (ribonuclease M5)
MKGNRSMDNRRIEKLTDSLFSLSDYSSEGVPILVEGKKDESALKRLGVSGRIVRIRQRHKRIFELVEELASQKAVVILTDFDKEGERLAHELSRQLHLFGVQTILRDELRSAMSWASRQIEGLVRTRGLREHLSNKQFIVSLS